MLRSGLSGDTAADSSALIAAHPAPYRPATGVDHRVRVRDAVGHAGAARTHPMITLGAPPRSARRDLVAGAGERLDDLVGVVGSARLEDDEDLDLTDVQLDVGPLVLALEHVGRDRRQLREDGGERPRPV